MKTQKTIADVGQLLENHINNSVNKRTSALNQIAPELIADKLKLKERIKTGFKSNTDILDFVTNYLENSSSTRFSWDS